MNTQEDYDAYIVSIVRYLEENRPYLRGDYRYTSKVAINDSEVENSMVIGDYYEDA